MTALLFIGAVLAYCLFVLVFPTAKCPRVVTVQRKGKPPKTKPCPKCKGHGWRVRFGARAVHRFAWSVAGDRFRGHLKARLEDPQETEEIP